MRKLMVFVPALVLLVSLAFSVSAAPNIPFSVQGTTYGSLNWGGYAKTTGTYGSASGTWVVPKLNSSVSGYSSAWVGIGGFSGNSVIQIGTEQDCLSGGTTAGEMRFHGLDMNAAIASSQSNPGKSNHGGNGGGKTKSSSCTPTYYSWWELYPQNAEQPITNMTIAPGDTVTAAVSEGANGAWTLTITDETSGESFTTVQKPNFTPDVASAEMIVERPSLCTPHHCSITNLADFGSIGFSDMTTNYNMTFTGADGIVMVNNGGTPLINLGSLNGNGDAFSVDWLSSK